MVGENQNTQRLETPSLRLSSSTYKHKRSVSENGTGSKGIFSRVIGSFRHKHHDEKRKTDEPLKHQQLQLSQEVDENWIANYKITHHPDRPKVDKRIARELSNLEYATELHRMQERSQKHYELDHSGVRGMSVDRSVPPPLPPLQISQQASVPNLSYSPESPKRNKEENSPPFPYDPPEIFNRPVWLPPDEDELGRRGHSRKISDPVSPGAMTIQVYRSSAVDGSGPRGPHSSVGHNQQEEPLLPRRAYNPNESYAKRTMRDSGYARKASSSSADSSQAATKTVHRRAPSSNLHSSAAAAAAATAVVDFGSIPLTSSPTSYAAFLPPPQQQQRQVRSLDDNANRNVAARKLPTLSLSSSSPTKLSKKPSTTTISDPITKACVMPGCTAPLLSHLDREQNVCAPCRKEFRQSTFDAASTATTPRDSDLATLRALVGTLDDSHSNTRTTSLNRETPVRLYNKASSNFHSGALFRLQPAPPGKKQRQHPGSGASNQPKTSGTRPPVPASAWSSSTTSGVSQQGSGSSNQFQPQPSQQKDRRLTRASRKVSDALSQAMHSPPLEPLEEKSTASEAEAEEEAETETKPQYSSYLTESPRTSSSSDWTSEPPKSESGSVDGSDAGKYSPLADDSSEVQQQEQHIELLAPVAYVPAGGRDKNSGYRPEIPRQVSRSTDSNSRRPSGARVMLPPPPSPLSRPIRPSRDTVLYQAIDDIIESYTVGQDGEVTTPPMPLSAQSENGRRRLESIASYYAGAPDDVEMKRMGFI